MTSNNLLLFRELAKEGNVSEIHVVIIYMKNGTIEHRITGITNELKEYKYRKTLFWDGSRFTETYDAERLTIEYYKRYLKSLDDERYGL